MKNKNFKLCGPSGRVASEHLLQH